MDVFLRQMTDVMSKLMMNSTQFHREFVEALVKSRTEQLVSNSFLRRMVSRLVLTNGQITCMDIDMVNSPTVAYAISPTKSELYTVKTPKFSPPEFFLEARHFITTRDVQSSASGWLGAIEFMINELDESLMVKEERLLWSMVQLVAKDPIVFDSDREGSTYDTFLRLIDSSGTSRNGGEETYNFKDGCIFVGQNTFTKLRQTPEWCYRYTPSSEKVQETGMFGTWGKNFKIYSDMNRRPSHRVLPPKAMVVLDSPDRLGQFTDRDGWSAEILTSATEKSPGRGLLAYETFSLVIRQTAVKLALPEQQA